MAHPEAEDVIPGSGGARKLRWTLSTQKNVAETIASHVLKKIKEEIDG